MDTIAAILAAKNQLEADKSRKQQQQSTMQQNQRHNNRSPHQSPNAELYRKSLSMSSPQTKDATIATTNFNADTYNNNGGVGGGRPLPPPVDAPPPPTNVVSFDTGRRTGGQSSYQIQGQQQPPEPAEYVPWGNLGGGGMVDVDNLSIDDFYPNLLYLFYH